MGGWRLVGGGDEKFAKADVNASTNAACGTSVSRRPALFGAGRDCARGQASQANVLHACFKMCRGAQDPARGRRSFAEVSWLSTLAGQVVLLFVCIRHRSSCVVLVSNLASYLHTLR